MKKLLFLSALISFGSLLSVKTQSLGLNCLQSICSQLKDSSCNPAIIHAALPLTAGLTVASIYKKEDKRVILVSALITALAAYASYKTELSRNNAAAVWYAAVVAPLSFTFGLLKGLN